MIIYCFQGYLFKTKIRRFKYLLERNFSEKQFQKSNKFLYFFTLGNVFLETL